MAPEQIMAQIVGPRADQFSLAVLAYQLLTGHRPFEGASAPEMMRQVLHSEPPPVHAANLLLPPAVNDVFQRALSKDPDQRYGNCTEFVSEMGRLLASAGTPESVGPVAKHQAREGAAHASAAPTGASLFSRDSALPWLRSRRIWLSVAAGACLTILTVALFLAKTRKPAKDVTERYATTASRRGLDTEAAHVSGDSSRTVSAPPTSSKSARPSSPTATVPIVAEHYPTAVSTKDSGAEVTPPSGGSNSTLSAPPTSSKPIAFSATTGLALWAVAANISGTVMLEGRVLKVMVSDWSLSRPATYSDPADVVSIGVSVSRFTGEPTNSWQRLRKTDFNSHPLPLSLLPGHKIDLPPFGLNIPIDNFEVKAGDWLTFNIGLRHIKDGKETMGEVYAHWHPPVPPPAGWPGRPGTLTVTDGAAPSRTPTADPVLDANARAAEVNHAEGLQLFDRQNFAEAILKFTEAIRLKPDFAEAYFDRCRASDRLNSPSMASQRLEDCGKAIQLKSGFAEAYHYRGRAYAARLQYQLAMQDYDEALRYSPGDGSVITDRGFLYAAQNKPDLAIKEYDELIRIKPNDSYGYFARAREYNRQHRPELAIPDCNEAIRLNPKQGWAFWAYGARADAYRIQGKYDLAISDYDEALRLNPNWAEAYTSRAKAKEAIGDKPGADSDRERARELKR
jgi:tetratricopeptide (TPR) repeat protein